MTEDPARARLGSRFGNWEEITQTVAQATICLNAHTIRSRGANAVGVVGSTARQELLYLHKLAGCIGRQARQRFARLFRCFGSACDPSRSP